jgi:hypothetical protein
MGGRMKRLVAVLVLVMMMPTISMGDALDTKYVNLIFEKFESYDDETKKERSELLSLLMSSDKGLELLYSEIVDNRKDSMDKYGISEAVLRRNIDALKTWRASDRKLLVSAGVSGDKDAIYELNEKYADEDESDEPSKPTGPSTPVSPTDLEETGEVVIVSHLEKMIKKGLISKERKEIEELKDKSFIDVERHWSKDDVLFLVRRGMINGRDEKHYAPSENITKAEVVTIITKLLIENDENLDKYEGGIKDIEQGKWYDDHMKKAYVLGLVHENNMGNLEPNHIATKEEVVEILINAIESLEIDIDDEAKVFSGSFKDFDVVTKSRQVPMAIAINLGFIKGIDEETIAPKGEITRAEMATVVKRMYLYIMKQLEQ